MCMGCYMEYGSTRVLDAKVLRAVDLISSVYDFSSVGGNAHVALDDWNLEDETLRWCLDEALPENLHEASAEQLAAERAALEAMLDMTLEQRASALAIFDGYLDSQTGTTTVQ